VISIKNATRNILLGSAAGVGKSDSSVILLKHSKPGAGNDPLARSRTDVLLLVLRLGRELSHDLLALFASPHVDVSRRTVRQSVDMLPLVRALSSPLIHTESPLGRTKRGVTDPTESDRRLFCLRARAASRPAIEIGSPWRRVR